MLLMKTTRALLCPFFCLLPCSTEAAFSLVGGSCGVSRTLQRPSRKFQKRKNSPFHAHVLSDPIGTPSQDNNNYDDPQLGAWIPVGSASSLTGLTPVQIEIMGTNYVVWDSPKNDDNNNNIWSVMVDVCPHRLVPLSQGRINPESGCIECAYHGWQFSANGTLTCLPQLDPNASSFESIQRTAAASSVSVHLTGDLIWAFLPTCVHGESFPKSVLPEEYYYPGLVEDTARGATYYVHEMPCSFDMIVENGLDPSHFPFAHHGVISRRSDAAPMPMMKAVTSNFTHLDIFTSYKRNGQSRDRLYSFQRPSLLYTQEKAKDFSSSSSWNQSSKFFVVPIREGRSRVITSVEKLTKPYLPDWITHMATGRLFVGDYFLHEAERWRRSRKGKAYNEPTQADTGSKAWNAWLKQQHYNVAPPHTFGPASIENLSPMSRRDIQDPWRVHTATCSKCRRVLKRARLAQFWSVVAGVVGASMSMMWKKEGKQRPVLAAVAAIGGLLGSLLGKKLANFMEGSVHPSDISDRSFSMKV